MADLPKEIRAEAKRLIEELDLPTEPMDERQLQAIASALSRARAEAIEEAAGIPSRVVLTEIRGLDGLTLTGPERDEWIVTATARKVLAATGAEIRALSAGEKGKDHA